MTGFWFAAKTRFGQEISIKRKLEQLGIQHFIPTRMKKNYRNQNREHPVISNLVFIRTTKQEATSLKTELGLPLNYMFDYISHTMLVVPDKQMEDFQRVFEVSMEEGGLMDQPLEIGDKVRVAQGALKGVDGNVLEIQGQYYVVVSLCGSIFARAKVPRAFLEFSK